MSNAPAKFPLSAQMIEFARHFEFFCGSRHGDWGIWRGFTSNKGEYEDNGSFPVRHPRPQGLRSIGILSRTRTKPKMKSGVFSIEHSHKNCSHSEAAVLLGFGFVFAFAFARTIAESCDGRRKLRRTGSHRPLKGMLLCSALPKRQDLPLPNGSSFFSNALIKLPLPCHYQ
jgi:hypothetical protein